MDGADIDIMVKPDASLANVGALGQHRRGSPALFSAQQRFLEGDAVVPVVPKGLLASKRLHRREQIRIVIKALDAASAFGPRPSDD